MLKKDDDIDQFADYFNEIKSNIAGA
jgi:hypothetical protein